MPSIPLATELQKRLPELTECLARVQPGPDGRFAAGALPRPLRPVDPPSQMWASVDSRIFVRARPVLDDGRDKIVSSAAAEHAAVAVDEAAPSLVRGQEFPTTVHREPGMREAVFFTPRVTVRCECSVEPEIVDVDATLSGTDTTAALYDAACAPLAALFAEGGSANVLCYGQTGSGKTYTTQGLLRCIAPRLGRLAQTAVLSAVALEMHVNGVRDLLAVEGPGVVQVVEATDGTMQLLGATEVDLEREQCVHDLMRVATAARSTTATLRNAASSRSHMVVRFHVRPRGESWALPGVFHFVDLAGSESTADAAHHDKGRVKESQFINSSLMTLKECIRARGAAGLGNGSKHVHIPYRRTPLTLLLRDAFELMVKRPTKTALIACVSPLLRDARHTQNTLRYAGLLYVSPRTAAVATRDPHDPRNWDRDRALSFLKVAMGRAHLHDRIAVLLPQGDGRALADTPEPVFLERCTRDLGLGEKEAQALYAKLWRKIIDARTRGRQEMTRAKTHDRWTVPRDGSDPAQHGAGASSPSRIAKVQRLECGY